MRIARTLAPGRIEIAEAEEPVPGPEQALLDVQVVGICGSDYHLFRGTHPYARFPLVQGHEFSGLVRTLPPDYTGPARVGDMVAVEPLIPCGTCLACSRGRYNCCARLLVLGAHVPGALADSISVRTESLHLVGDLDAELAALVEPVSIGLQAVDRGEIGRDDDVVVLGGGPIGLASTLAAARRGARVLVADRFDSRLRAARGAGAASTVNTDSTDLLTSAADFTGRRGAAVVIDATGVPELIRTAVDLVAHSGTVVVVGISDLDVAIPVVEFTRKELDIRGSRNSRNLFPEAIEMIRAHRDEVRSWVTHRVGLDDVPSVIKRATEHPEDVEKVVVRVAGSPRWPLP